MICYCTAPIWGREKGPILKMASNGGVFSSSTKIFSQQTNLPLMRIPALRKYHTDDMIKFILVARDTQHHGRHDHHHNDRHNPDHNNHLHCPRSAVALRQIASPIFTPKSNKSPISFLCCNCMVRMMMRKIYIL